MEEEKRADKKWNNEKWLRKWKYERSCKINKRINKHEYVLMNLNDKSIVVDKNIAYLVRELNSAGLKTMASCEGESSPKSICDLPYVTINMNNAFFSYDPKRNVLCIHWNKAETKVPIPESYIEKF